MAMVVVALLLLLRTVVVVHHDCSLSVADVITAAITRVLMHADIAGCDITCVFYDVLDFLSEGTQPGMNTYVHCQQGVSRSTPACGCCGCHISVCCTYGTATCMMPSNLLSCYIVEHLRSCTLKHRHQCHDRALPTLLSPYAGHAAW